MAKDDFFTNPYKTYLEEKYKEEDQGHLFRQADGRLVPKSSGYHKWNPLKKAYDWIAPSSGQNGFQRIPNSMKPRPAPKTAPTDEIFMKAEKKLAPAIAAAIKAAQDELEHKKIRKAQIKTKEQQLIVKRQNQIEKNSQEISKDKKGKGWFGEERIHEGIWNEIRATREVRRNPPSEPIQRPNRTGVFQIKTPHPLGPNASNDEILNWLHSTGVDLEGARVRRTPPRIDWDEGKKKPTVHEELFTNPFKTEELDESAWRYVGRVVGGGLGGAIGGLIGGPAAATAGAISVGGIGGHLGALDDIENAMRKHRDLQKTLGNSHPKTQEAEKNMINLAYFGDGTFMRKSEVLKLRDKVYG